MTALQQVQALKDEAARLNRAEAHARLAHQPAKARELLAQWVVLNDELKAIRQLVKL